MIFEIFWQVQKRSPRFELWLQVCLDGPQVVLALPEDSIERTRCVCALWCKNLAISAGTIGA